MTEQSLASKAFYRARPTLERALWLLAFVCFVFCSATALLATRAQSKAAAILPPVQAGQPVVSSVAKNRGKAAHVEGRIEVRSLGLKAPILSTCSDSALRLGSCHVPGTADAGGLGNMGIAGHRDGTFRPLRRVKIGDEVDIFSEDGHYTYLVTSMSVVPADDTSVLAIGEQPEVTLITCFPFNYIGSAPKRFVVHAKLLSVDSAS